MPAIRGRELAAYLFFSALWSGNWLVIERGLAGRALILAGVALVTLSPAAVRVREAS